MKKSDLFLFYILIAILLPLPIFSQSPNVTFPVEIFDQDWRIHSLLEDGHLENQYLTYVDFEKDGTAWIGSSNGLFRYDGYSWNRYSIGEGLPSSFVRCVLITKDGQRWIGTDQGAGIFDEISFQTMGSEYGLSGQCVRRIREDASGPIWFCCDCWPRETDPGGLTSYKNGKWTVYGVQDGLPSHHVIDFFEDSQGRQFVLTLKGLAQRDGERWFCPLRDQNIPGYEDLFWSIAESPTYGVIVTTGSSVFVLKDNQWTRYVCHFPRQFKLCRTRDGEIVSSSDNGSKKNHFLVWNGSDFLPVSAGFKSPYREIGHIKEAPDGSIWCIGFNCLIRWQRRGGEWTEFSNLPSPRFVDNQDRVWFFAGKQTVLWDGRTWGSMVNVHSSLARDSSGNVWGWSHHGVSRWSTSERRDFSPEEIYLAQPERFNEDASGKFYFSGTDSHQQNRISIFDGLTWIYRPVPEIQEGTIIGSTPDPEKGIWYLIVNREENGFRLVRVCEDLVETQTVDSSIASPFPTLFRIDEQRNFWLYGHFGLLRLMNRQTDVWMPVESLRERNVTSSVLQKDDLWFGVTSLVGGLGNLVQYKKGQFSFFPAEPQELGILADDGSVLFAGDDCIYQISSQTGQIPRKLYIPESGLIVNLLKDHHDRLWIGLHGSVLCYRSDAIPPETRIINRVSDIIIGGNLDVKFQAYVRFNSFLQGEKFLFSWQIDSGEWTEFQESPKQGLSMDRLTPGKHILRVRAQDDNLNIDPTPESLEFLVLPTPLQEKIWFFPLMMLLVIAIIFLALYALVTKHKLAYHARNLEDLVQERTYSLHEKEATLQSIFRSAPIGIGLASNRILSWINNNLCEMTGYTSDELIGQNIQILYANEEEYLNVVEIGYRAEQSQSIQTLETRWQRKDGKIIDVLLYLIVIDSENPSLGITFSALDITDRKKTAKTLEENERIFREAIEVAGAVPYYQDYKTNLYVYTGPGIQELLGYSAEEFTPQIWTSLTQEMILLGELQSLTEKEAIQKARGEEGVSWRADYRIRTRSGEERWIANAAVQVRDENGKVVGSLGILQNITERKQLENQLRQAQKMEAVGQLAGGLAHNINNLLTGIIGNQSLALMKSPQELHPYLTNANNAAIRAAELVKSLLAFSRKTSLELGPINLNHIVKDVYHLVHETFDRRIEIELQACDSLPGVLADANQIHSVLMNLCINARDAIDHVIHDPTFEDRRGDHFKITLKTEIVKLQQAPPAYISSVPSDTFVALHVSDNGSGIDEETQKHIFEPFFTTKETVGTGLGLASAFGILKQHNGWIDFKSQYRKGSTFSIYFPRLEEPTEEKTIHPKVVEGNFYGNETILLVDDEELIVNLAEEILHQYGYQVLKAKDGRECLDLFFEKQELIDLIILDLSMPRLSGSEVMKQILDRNPSVKILISSGHADGLKTEYLLEKGAVGILLKPYKLLDFLSKVRDVLDG